MAAPEGEVLEHIPYKITSQEKTEQFTPAGNFEVVWRVGFQAPNGTHGYVTIPDAQYDPANVDVVIQGELGRIMGVHGLGETPHPDNLPASEGGPPEG